MLIFRCSAINTSALFQHSSGFVDMSGAAGAESEHDKELSVPDGTAVMYRLTQVDVNSKTGTYNTLTVHLQYTHSTLTIHLQFTYTTFAIHLQYTYSTLTVHLQYTYSTLTLHLHYTYTTPTTVRLQ